MDLIFGIIRYKKNSLVINVAKNISLFFIIFFPLVYGLPEIMLLLMAILGLYYAKKDGYFFSKNNFRTAIAVEKYLIFVPLLFSSVFFLKFLSVIWADNNIVAIHNAFNHIHFLFWPALIPFFRRVDLSLERVEKIIAILLFILMAWYLGAKLFFPLSEDATCFKAGGHNCGLFGQTVAFFIIWVFLIITRPGVEYHLRIFYISSWMAGWVAFIGTMRRAELLVIITAMIVILIVRIKNSIHKRVLIFAIAFAFIFSIGSVYLMKDRFGLIQSEVSMYMSGGEQRILAVNTSVGARLEMYRVAIEAIGDRPLLGWGAGIKPRHLAAYATVKEQPLQFSNFHNQILQPLLEVGLLGGLLILGMVIYLLRETIFKTYYFSGGEISLIFFALWSVYIIKGFVGVTIGYGHVNALFVFYSAWLWSKVIDNNIAISK